MVTWPYASLVKDLIQVQQIGRIRDIEVGMSLEHSVIFKNAWVTMRKSTENQRKELRSSSLTMLLRRLGTWSYSLIIVIWWLSTKFWRKLRSSFTKPSWLVFHTFLVPTFAETYSTKPFHPSISQLRPTMSFYLNVYATFPLWSCILFSIISALTLKIASLVNSNDVLWSIELNFWNKSWSSTAEWSPNVHLSINGVCRLIACEGFEKWNRWLGEI